MCRELVALVSLSWGLRFGAGAPGATKASSKPKDAITPWQMDFLLGRSSHAIFCQQPPSAARVHLHQRGRTLPPALWRLDFIDKRGSMCSVDVDSIHKTCALSLSLSARSLSLSRSLALSLSRSLALSRSLSLSLTFFRTAAFSARQLKFHGRREQAPGHSKSSMKHNRPRRDRTVLVDRPSGLGNRPQASGVETTLKKG